MAILIVIIACGMVCLVIPGLRQDFGLFNIKYETFFLGTTSNPNLYVSAMIGAFWSYSGYSATCNIAEEIKEPLKKNVVGSAIISILGVTAIYILTNFSYFLILSPIEMLSSDAVAVTLGAKFYVPFAIIIRGFVCLSIFGSMNIAVINGSREVLSASRRRQLPVQLSLLNVKR